MNRFLTPNLILTILAFIRVCSQDSCSVYQDALAWLSRSRLKKIRSTSTKQPESDEDLLTPKEALDLLSGSMLRMKRGRLSKLELLEVRTVVQLVSRYFSLYAKFVKYDDLEKKLLELSDKYAQLAGKRE